MANMSGTNLREEKIAYIVTVSYSKYLRIQSESITNVIETPLPLNYIHRK